MSITDLFTKKPATIVIPDKEAQTPLQSIVNALDSAIVVLAPHGEVIFFNTALLHLFSLQSPPKHVNDIQNALGEAYNLSSKFFTSVYQKSTVEESHIMWEGKYLKISIFPVPNDVGYLLTFHDQTNEMALSRARDEFFSIASHELRTPLTIIKGNASMLVDLLKQNTSDQQKIANDILVSSDRLIRIVNGLLEISELEQRKVKFAKEPFSIREVIDQLATNNAAKFEANHIEFKIIGNGDVPQVLADKTRTIEILQELISNSLKNTQNGTITVTYSKTPDFVEVSVSDTGRGISSELQSLLFRKFQQAGESLYARNVEGVGLGLYISRLLIEGMGGRIKLLNSTPGIGTTFSFTLPSVS